MNQYSEHKLNKTMFFMPGKQIPAQPEPDLQAFVTDANLCNDETGIAGCEVPLFDVKRIDVFSGGDKNFTAMLIGLFISTTPPLLLQLEHAATFSIPGEVISVAHKLKSTVDTMGIDAAGKLIREIEHHAKFVDETSLIEVKSKAFNIMVDKSIVQMKQWLVENGK